MRIPRITFLILFFSASIAWAGSILSTTEAAKHIGERATVCGDIAGEHTAPNSRGAPTFINLDKPYPNQVFTVLVWGSDRANVGNLPRSERICATA
jgi:micrococcal nuclease